LEKNQIILYFVAYITQTTIKPMIKNHETPEFQVIKQSEANAKFFVASGGSASGTHTQVDAVTVYNNVQLGGSWS